MTFRFHTNAHTAATDALRIAWRQSAAWLSPPRPDGSVAAVGPRERQGRFLGSLLAAALPLVVLGFAAGLLTRSAWSLVLGPLCLVLLTCARLNREGRIRAANWLLPAALTLAGIGMEISRRPWGPAPLLLDVGAVFLSGFQVGRRTPFAFAVFSAAFEELHLHMLLRADALPVALDGGPPLTWRPLIAVIVLSMTALVSFLIAGILEDVRVRADELVRVNAALADSNTHLEAMVTADLLTGLPNHRGLVAALDAELERAQRYGRTCVLLFLDIDHFKALNDGYGHATGDAILQQFARLVRGALRGVDLLGRWGGEEFVILLPELDMAGAAAAAERVRAAVAEHVFPMAGGLRLTCSVGMAAYPVSATERGPLVDAADRAMYAAKHLGRNQVRCADDPSVSVLLMDCGGHGSREEAAIVGTVEALSALVAARDCYAGEHSQEVAALAMRLSVALGLGTAEARMVGLAGRLHDIGKVGVPDAILHKAGRLSEDDWAIIRRHPLVGAEVVGHAPTLRPLAPLIRGHHERWAGGGYPDGLAGEAIPLGARVLAVADAYLAMTSDRPYRRARDHAWALEQIGRRSGTRFDPRVVEALMGVLQPADEGRPGSASAWGRSDRMGCAGSPV